MCRARDSRNQICGLLLAIAEIVWTIITFNEKRIIRFHANSIASSRLLRNLRNATCAMTSSPVPRPTASISALHMYLRPDMKRSEEAWKCGKARPQHVAPLPLRSFRSEIARRAAVGRPAPRVPQDLRAPTVKNNLHAFRIDRLGSGEKSG